MTPFDANAIAAHAGRLHSCIRHSRIALLAGDTERAFAGLNQAMEEIDARNASIDAYWAALKAATLSSDDYRSFSQNPGY